MTKLEIPEGYCVGPYEVMPHETGYYVKVPGIRTKGTELALALAPAMAEEIKRLREELEERTVEVQSLTQDKADMQEIIDYNIGEVSRLESVTGELRKAIGSPATREDRAFQCLQGLLANPSYSETPTKGILQIAIESADAMLAALAKPQTEPIRTQETLDQFKQLESELSIRFSDTTLPSGCEPFDLERAKVEGARDKDGLHWDFEECTDGDFPHYRFKTKDRVNSMIFDNNGKSWLGYSCPPVNLYCIAKRLPFDLAKALAGAPVVTRDGRPVTDIKRNEGNGESCAITGYIEGKQQDYWHEDGHYSVHHIPHKADLFMEASV
jgi:hypothetical protein